MILHLFGSTSHLLRASAPTASADLAILAQRALTAALSFSVKLIFSAALEPGSDADGLTPLCPSS